MNDIVYIVTSEYYSDYSIDAVFKDKSKAEFYCKCHSNCEIEEYYYSDEKIFTPYDAVNIRFVIYINENRFDSRFYFFKAAKEDNLCSFKNTDSVYIYGNEIKIYLSRLLPNNYKEEVIRKKYTKVCRDLMAEILYLVSESDRSTYDKRRIVAENIKEYIKGKFGIEREDEDLV